MKHVVLALSGGVDSSTLLYHLMAEGHTVTPVTVFYGQRHRREIESARAIASLAGVTWCPVDLGALATVFDTALVAEPAARHNFAELQGPGRFRDETEDRWPVETRSRTVVPNRNMVLLAVLAAKAASCGADTVAYAATGSDASKYPDCRPQFVEAMRGALRICHWDPIELVAPFAELRWSKAAVVRRGMELGVPYELTWSCYDGGDTPCGVCVSCRERIKAFAEAGYEDPWCTMSAEAR